MARFVKGQPRPAGSGRQAGQPTHAARELRELVREHSPQIVAELLKLALGARKEAIRLAALRELMDRGWGKPVPAADNGEAGGPLWITVEVVDESPTASLPLVEHREPDLLEAPRSEPELRLVEPARIKAIG
jgi:hypothetical protein